MIQALTGLPGFGKTATCAKWAYNKQREGKTVYANFPLKGAIPYHEPMEVLGKVKNSLIVMDEAGLLLDGLRLFDFPYEIFYELRQHRKDGVDLLLTAQSLLDVAFPFRRLIQFENRIQMKIGPFVQVNVRDPQPGGAVFGKQLWYLSGWVFKIYRSYYKVKPPEYLGLDVNGIDKLVDQFAADGMTFTDQAEQEMAILRDLIMGVPPKYHVAVV
jgi:hypothetical protein